MANHIDAATNALEAGFLSEAARKRALDNVNRAYDLITRAVREEHLAYFHALPHDDNGRPVLAADEQANHDRIRDLYYGIPALHVLKDKHFAAYAEWPRFEAARDLVALRAAIKAAEIVKHERPVKENDEVRKYVIKTLEERKAEFVSGVKLAHLFGGLHVTASAHWVYGHKGARFIRYFFYLNGRFTALNMIMAIAEKYQADTKGR
jgi:hypothetical protein